MVWAIARAHEWSSKPLLKLRHLSTGLTLAKKTCLTSLPIKQPSRQSSMRPFCAPLLRAIEKCEIDEEKLTFASDCPALQAIDAFDDDKSFVMADGVKMGEIKKKLLNSDMHKVRSWFVVRMRTGFGLAQEDKPLDIGKTTTDLMVIKSAINALSNSMSDPAVADFVLSHADNKNAGVRLEVARSASNSWSANIEGIVDVAIKFLSDEDLEIQKHTCKYISSLKDEKVIEHIDAILKNKEQVNCHADCMEGLNTLWDQWPSHKNTNATAYKASLNDLKQKPRTKDSPPWNCIEGTSLINKDTIEDWKKRASYFKVNEHVAVMLDIAADASVNWMGRNAAIKVIAAWGTKKGLQNLKKKLASDKSENVVQIIRTVDEAIAKKDK